MTNKCSNCPRNEQIKLAIELCLGETETVQFRQWQTVDRATLTTLELPRFELIDKLAEKIIELRLHHFIARKQGAYLKDLKENLSAEECILLCDFAENYNSIVQDAIQSFYWLPPRQI